MDVSSDRYLEFASKISFFQFIVPEYRATGLDIKSFEQELSILEKKHDWDPIELSKFIRDSPRSFTIFQAIFQQLRFTDAQMIHFLFNISLLNDISLNVTFEYALDNLRDDPNFAKVFSEISRKRFKRDETWEEVIRKSQKTTVVALFKMTVPIYENLLQEDDSLLASRLSKLEFSCSTRIANYLLSELDLNSTLKSLSLRDFLINKKYPIDTKAIHGNYLKDRIKNILDAKGVTNIDKELLDENVSILPSDITQILKEHKIANKRVYCTEKYIEDVPRMNDKEKRFDVVIIIEGKPRYLFELNFYTTAGTKIGINENEYVELLRVINQNTNYHFNWITDGNYWLTKGGEKRLKNLWTTFGTIYNANSFESNLSDFV